MSTSIVYIDAIGKTAAGEHQFAKARLSSIRRESILWPLSKAVRARYARYEPISYGRVEMWRAGCRLNISVAASFVWRCLSGSTMTPFPHPAHRTGQADLPHPALGQDLTPSPTARRAQACSDVRARSARKGARVDSSRPCAA